MSSPLLDISKAGAAEADQDLPAERDGNPLPKSAITAPTRSTAASAKPLASA